MKCNGTLLVFPYMYWDGSKQTVLVIVRSTCIDHSCTNVRVFTE